MILSIDKSLLVIPDEVVNNITSTAKRIHHVPLLVQYFCHISYAMTILTNAPIDANRMYNDTKVTTSLIELVLG